MGNSGYLKCFENISKYSKYSNDISEYYKFSVYILVYLMRLVISMIRCYDVMTIISNVPLGFLECTNVISHFCTDVY